MSKDASNYNENCSYDERFEEGRAYERIYFTAKLREKIINLPRGGNGTEATVRLEDMLQAIRE